jgi:hypothetical protein
MNKINAAGKSYFPFWGQVKIAAEVERLYENGGIPPVIGRSCLIKI